MHLFKAYLFIYLRQVPHPTSQSAQIAGLTEGEEEMFRNAHVKRSVLRRALYKCFILLFIIIIIRIGRENPRNQVGMENLI